MKQPKHFFNLETKAKANGECLIYFNLNYGFKKINPTSQKSKYTPMRISTQWTISKNYWDAKNYKANKTYVSKYGSDLNNRLETIRRTSYDQLSFYRNTHKQNPEPEPAELKKIIETELGRIEANNTDKLITDYIDALITRRTSLEKTSSQHWSEKSKKQFLILNDHIRKYEEIVNTRLSFEKMTEEIYLDYFKVLSETPYDKHGNFYMQTTIAKDCKNLKVVLNCANEDDIKVGFNFNKKSLKIHAQAAKSRTYLTEDQLIKIIETDVTHSKEFQHARNYIILSSFTGLRIEDMQSLHELNPATFKHSEFDFLGVQTKIRKAKDKGKELEVVIPILAPVRDLLKSNNNKFPQFPSEPNVRKFITKFLKHLEFNDEVEERYKYFKKEDVVKIEPLYNVFTPHGCRATFITNLKQLGVHNETIEPITHPKAKYASILDSYDKSKLVDKGVRFVKSINQVTSPIYKF